MYLKIKIQHMYNKGMYSKAKFRVCPADKPRTVSRGPRGPKNYGKFKSMQDMTLLVNIFVCSAYFLPNCPNIGFLHQIYMFAYTEKHPCIAIV